MKKTETVSEYLARIGKRGGKKRAAHPKRAELAQAAAQARWARQHLLESFPGACPNCGYDRKDDARHCPECHWPRETQ